MTGMSRRPKLPRYVKFSHGAYYYVRWNPAEKRVKWTPLGKTYPQMLRALAEVEEGGVARMADVIDRYDREVVAKQAANTRHNRLYQIKRLRRSFGRMRPQAITPQHVYRYLDERTRAGSPVSANRDVSLLRAIFTKAIRWGHVTTNPATKIERNPEKPRDRYVTDAEYNAVHDAAPEQVRLAMDLAYLTGQRISDVLSLRVNQIDDQGVHFRQAKTGKRLIVEVSPALEAVLRECRSGKVASIYVLSNARGQRYNYEAIAQVFRRVVKRCVTQGKIESTFTFHDLRAKAGSETEGDLLGHADPRTLVRVYKRLPARAKPVR